MRIEQAVWTQDGGWRPQGEGRLSRPADLVLVFGSRSTLESPGLLADLRDRHPEATFLGCSTAGEIAGTSVFDESMVATAVEFEKTALATARASVERPEDSRAAGTALAQSIDHRGLVHAFVLSDGLNVNGTELVKGLAEGLPADVTVTGGLSGDGASFEKTLVVWRGEAQPSTVTILGLYGSDLRVGYGSLGGWDSFGPERMITRSRGNILYELDNQSALDLYKTYLGEHASGLPATGLLFPLALRGENGHDGVVRTILAVDEREKSMVFAGDVPEGAHARLMKANFDRLIDGAIGAARTSYEALHGSDADLAILISCVGRKMVLKGRVEEEVEGVREVVGPRTVLTGFYSYGEISPFTPNARCELHNQTMTVTTLTER